jgi:hypothetical protein
VIALPANVKEVVVALQVFGSAEEADGLPMVSQCMAIIKAREEQTRQVNANALSYVTKIYLSSQWANELFVVSVRNRRTSK